MTQTDGPSLESDDSNIEYGLAILDRAKAPSRMPKMWFETNRFGESVAMYRVGGVAYPMVTVQSCKTCTHKYRADIENAVIEGYGYNRISRDIPEDSVALSGRNIREHRARGHMPLEPMAIRDIQEARAAQLGLDIMNGSTLADYITLGQTVISKVYRKLVQGEIQPDLKDALGFSRLLYQAQLLAGSDLDHEIVYNVFVEYQEKVMLHTDSSTYQLIAEDLANSPVIREMIERLSREQGQLTTGESEAEDAEWKDGDTTPVPV